MNKSSLKDQEEHIEQMKEEQYQQVFDEDQVPVEDLSYQPVDKILEKGEFTVKNTEEISEQSLKLYEGQSHHLAQSQKRIYLNSMQRNTNIFMPDILLKEQNNNRKVCQFLQTQSISQKNPLFSLNINQSEVKDDNDVSKQIANLYQIDNSSQRRQSFSPQNSSSDSQKIQDNQLSSQLQKYSQQQLIQSIQIMKKQVEQMQSLILQKQKYSIDNQISNKFSHIENSQLNSISNNKLQNSINNSVQSNIQSKDPNEINRLLSQYENNKKIQTIYQNQYQSFLKKIKLFQDKQKLYVNEIKNCANHYNDSQRSNENIDQHQPLNSQTELIQLISQKILSVKQTIVQTEKQNYYLKRQIKTNQTALQISESPESKSFSKNGSINNLKQQQLKYKSCIQLTQSINLKKKLQQKLKQKISKLQFQFNASFIKSEEQNDYFKSLIEQIPEVQKQPISSSALQKSSVLQKWSQKNNDLMLNKNLYQILKKRKQKAFKANQLTRKQFQHQQQELQRDIKGLQKIIFEKQKIVEDFHDKNAYIQTKNQSFGSLRKDKPVDLKRINKMEQNRNKQPQKIIQTQKQQQAQKQINVYIPQILSIPSKSNNKNQNLMLKIKQPQVIKINLTNKEPQINLDTKKQQLKLNLHKENLQQEENLIENISIPITKQTQNKQQSPQQSNLQQLNSFRITKPKFKSLSKNQDEKNKKSFSFVNNQQNTPIYKVQNILSSPKLLKPSFSRTKNNNKRLLQTFIAISTQRNSYLNKSNTQVLQRQNQQIEGKTQQKQKQTQQISIINIDKQNKPTRPYLKEKIIQFSTPHQKQKVFRPQKQFQSSLRSNKRQQQMMDVLKNSIVRVASQSRKKKFNIKQVNNEQNLQIDHKKTLRNLISENVSMIKNQAFSSREFLRNKSNVSSEQKYEVSRNIDKEMDDKKTPKVKQRPFIFSKQMSHRQQKEQHNKLQQSKLNESIYIRKIAQNLNKRNKQTVQQEQNTLNSYKQEIATKNKYFSSPSNNRKSQQNKKTTQQTSIVMQMEKVKSQIQQTILKIQNIEQKLHSQSLVNLNKSNSKFRKSRFYRMKSLKYMEELESEQIQNEQKQNQINQIDQFLQQEQK